MFSPLYRRANPLQRLGFSCVCFCLSLGALAAPKEPPRVELSADERVRARAGQVVVRQNSEDGVHLMAAVYVEATPRELLRAVMDLRSRVDDVERLVGVETYTVEGKPAARWFFDATIREVDFSVIYDCDWNKFLCDFGLDPARESEVPQADGSFWAVPEDQGCWLEYHSQTQPHPLLPAPIREERRERSTQQMLMGMKRRAEGPR